MKIKNTLTAANGKTVDADVVFVAAFKHLQSLTKKWLKQRKMRGIRDENIQWIITVPAIWNDDAKHKMREWTIKAGLVNSNIQDQCKIVYEPDCASLTLQQKMKSCAPMKKGDKYILVDAGGGTMDIACHQIVDKVGVEEVLHPSGGPWGSCYIDDQFVEVLVCLFSSKWINEYKTSHSDQWQELMSNFQSAKEAFKGGIEHHFHNVRVPLHFIEFMQDKLDQFLNGGNMDEVELEDHVYSKSVFGHKKLIKTDISSTLIC